VQIPRCSFTLFMQELSRSACNEKRQLQTVTSLPSYPKHASRRMDSHPRTCTSSWTANVRNEPLPHRVEKERACRTQASEGSGWRERLEKHRHVEAKTVKVKVCLTYRGVPYEIELSASDASDIVFLLREVVGDVIAEIQAFIDTQLAKEAGQS